MNARTHRLTIAVVALFAVGSGFAVPVHAEVVEHARLSEGLVVSPIVGSVNTLVAIKGPGKFVSARMTKQGGLTGLTAISLEIDGQIIENRNIIALKNIGLGVDNPYGVMVNTSAAGIDVVTIGFPQTLSFERSLELKAHVNEAGVVQIIGTVLAGQ
jgi:hypothetical protein